VTITGLLAYLAHGYRLFPGDRELARWLQTLDGMPLRRAMAGVSALGGWWLVALPPLGVVALLAGYRRWREMPFVLAALLPLGLNRALKLLVQRPRPGGELTLWLEGTNSSFPSGHAVHALAFYGFLLYLATRLVPPAPLRRGLQGLLAGLILATGASRVYLGAHWPSDVIGGYLVGAVLIIPVIWAYRRQHG